MSEALIYFNPYNTGYSLYKQSMCYHELNICLINCNALWEAAAVTAAPIFGGVIPLYDLEFGSWNHG